MASLSFRALLLRVLLRRFHVPRDMTRFAFRRYGPRTALIAPSGQRTFAELEARVLRLAAGWHALGLRKGDHPFTLLSDDLEYVERMKHFK